MPSLYSIVISLCQMAASTTLSGGDIVIILDQDRNGMNIIVGNASSRYLRDGDEIVYYEAIHRCLANCDSTRLVSRITTARFKSVPKTLNGMTLVRSRHAMIINWEGGVWLYTKSGPAFQLGREQLQI